MPIPDASRATRIHRRIDLEGDVIQVLAEKGIDVQGGGNSGYQ